MTDSQPRQLDGMTAMVTGGTSGIGRATALHLARMGARVIIHGRSPSEKSEEVLRLLSEVDSPAGESAHGFAAADFSQPLDWDAWVDDVWTEFGPITAWVNNAGGDVLTGTWPSRSLADKLDYLWRVDVTSTLMLSRAVGALMRIAAADHQWTPGTCSITNLGWDQAAHGMAGESGELFATTKGAIMASSRSLAQSLAPEIRVNCVAPGWIQTAWGAQASETWDHRARSESLMQRWGTPADVAAAIGFVISPASSFISGQVIPVNGGFRWGGQSSG